MSTSTTLHSILPPMYFAPGPVLVVDSSSSKGKSKITTYLKSQEQSTPSITSRICNFVTSSVKGVVLYAKEKQQQLKGMRLEVLSGKNKVAKISRIIQVSSVVPSVMIKAFKDMKKTELIEAINSDRRSCIHISIGNVVVGSVTYLLGVKMVGIASLISALGLNKIIKDGVVIRNPHTNLEYAAGGVASLARAVAVTAGCGNIVSLAISGGITSLMIGKIGITPMEGNLRFSVIAAGGEAGGTIGSTIFSDLVEFLSLSSKITGRPDFLLETVCPPLASMFGKICGTVSLGMIIRYMEYISKVFKKNLPMLDVELGENYAYLVYEVVHHQLSKLRTTENEPVLTGSVNHGPVRIVLDYLDINPVTQYMKDLPPWS